MINNQSSERRKEKIYIYIYIIIIIINKSADRAYVYWFKIRLILYIYKVLFKIEGDGCTPSGVYQLRRGFYRRYRLLTQIINSLSSSILFDETLPTDGWCDGVTVRLIICIINSSASLTRLLMKTFG